MRLIRPKARAGARVVGGTWFMELNNVGFVGDPWWSMVIHVLWEKHDPLIQGKTWGRERERDKKKVFCGGIECEKDLKMRRTFRRSGIIRGSKEVRGWNKGRHSHSSFISACSGSVEFDMLDAALCISTKLHGALGGNLPYHGTHTVSCILFARWLCFSCCHKNIQKRDSVPDFWRRTYPPAISLGNRKSPIYKWVPLVSIAGRGFPW